MDLDWKTYQKALVPAGVGVLLYLFSLVGLSGDMTLTDAATLLVTAGLVYLVPNKKK